MKNRLSAMRRVLAVQSQAKRLAEWQLAASEARTREIETKGRELDGFLDDAAISGDLALLALRQRRRLSVREIEAERELSDQIEATQEAKRLEQLAERLVDKFDAEARREQEKRQLEGLIEGYLNRRADQGGSGR